MDLTINILYESMNEKYKIETNNLRDATLQSFMVYNGEKLSSEFVYIITKEEIESCYESNLKNQTMICIGKPKDKVFDYKCNLLVIDENVDLLDLINYVSALFHKFNKWDNDIKEILRNSIDIKMVFERSKEVFDYPIALIDKSFFYIAYTEEYITINNYQNESRERIPLYHINHLTVEKEYQEAFDLDGTFYYSVENIKKLLCFNIKLNDRFIARLVAIPYDEPFSKAEYDIFSNLGILIQKMYIDNVNMIRDKFKNDDIYRLLRELLSDNVQTNSLDVENILSNYSWNPKDTYLVINFKFIINKDIGISPFYFCAELEDKWKGTYALEYNDTVVWIINQNKCRKVMEDEFRSKFAYMLRENMCKAGISYTFNNIMFLKNYLIQAQNAITLGSQIDKMSWYFYFEDYCLDYILKKSIEDIRPRQVSNLGLIKLLKYDEEENTDFYKTLYEYIYEKNNATHAANKLFIHRTTLLARLKKIKEITKLDLDDWDTRLHLMISFNLLDKKTL
ncbi:PucR family transcriptional regulator [Intestinibacter sp.]